VISLKRIETEYRNAYEPDAIANIYFDDLIAEIKKLRAQLNDAHDPTPPFPEAEESGLIPLQPPAVHSRTPRLTKTKMMQSEKINELVAALVKVHNEIEPITKDRTNPHFKNRYATLDAINDTVRPILTKHGLAIVQGGTPSERGISVRTMLLHTSGQWIASVFEMPMEKPTAQSVGSAITYGRRYGISAILALSTEEDDDGHAASQKKPPQKPAPVAATDDQIQQIIELAEATGTTDAVKPKLKTLTETKAKEYIEALTKKLKEKNG
jgi:hypothetical protein